MNNLTKKIRVAFLSFNILFGFIAALFGGQASAQTLDMTKFRIKAEQAIESVIGAENIEGDPKIVFRDGAGRLDLQPLIDYASYIYFVEVKPGVLPHDDLMIGYRLGLSEFEDIITVKTNDDESELYVSNAASLIVILQDEVSQKDLNDLVSVLQEASPQAEIQLLPILGFITVYAPILESRNLFQILMNSPVVADLRVDNEVYRIPFEFSPIVEVIDEGQINPDKYRDLTKTLKDEGFVFETETTIPDDLQ